MTSRPAASGWFGGDRLIAVAVAVGIALLLAESALRTLTPARAYGESDFIAFYCAGDVANAGRDPYRTRPLADCEERVQSDIGATSAQRFAGVDPAPLPPATLAVFRVFARLPYVAAARLFTLCVALACLATVVVLARTIALGDFETNATSGQLAAFCLLAMTLAGGALARGRPSLAGGFAALALLQPNAALPILAALALWVPGARASAAAGVVLFALAGLALGPAALTYEYVRVVPAQALAEVSSPNQLGSTWLLWFLGAPDGLAVRAGEVAYALFAGAAVLMARRTARALDLEAAIVWLPAASVVAFGVYVHGNQLAYVAPLALAIVAGRRGAARAAAVAGLLLVTVPFYEESRVDRLSAAIAIVAIVPLAAARASSRRRAALAAGAVVVAATVVIGIARLPTQPLHPPRDDISSYLATGPDLTLASGLLGIDDRATEPDSSLRALARRLPICLGLALLVAAVALIHGANGIHRAERPAS